MADRLSDEEIAALKGLLAVSVSPPWHTDDDVEGSVSDVVGMARDGETQIVVAECFTEDEARLIAATVSALPSLLSEVLASRSSPQPTGSLEGLDLAFLARLLASEPDMPFKPGRIEMDRATVEKLIAAASPQGERERALEEALRKAKLELEFRYAQIEDCEGALTPEGWRDYQARRTARATASSPHYAEKGD